MMNVPLKPITAMMMLPVPTLPAPLLVLATPDSVATEPAAQMTTNVPLKPTTAMTMLLVPILPVHSHVAVTVASVAME
jgi:hypothetical protein